MRFLKALPARIAAALMFLAPHAPVAARPAAAPPLSAPPAADTTHIAATPALWVVKDADTTIYLFGTIHLLAPRYDWLEGPVKQAFERSDELVVETVPPEGEEAQRIVTRLAVDPDGRSLRAKLPRRIAARYAKELAAAGLPANALDRYRPWFAALSLSMLQYNKMGLEPGSGVDQRLIAAARAAGKPVDPLEGFEQQLDFLATLSDRDQLRFLRLSLDDAQEAPKVIGKLTSAWATGDEDALAREMNKGMGKMPALARLLLDDRNARWAQWIKARLDRPGTVFVAVGAGHLGGRASVQAALAKLGIASERVR